MVSKYFDLRDADSSAASLLSSVRPGRRPERDGLVLGGEGALHSDGLVRVLHDHRVLLNDDVVHVPASILKS